MLIGALRVVLLLQVREGAEDRAYVGPKATRGVFQARIVARLGEAHADLGLDDRKAKVFVDELAQSFGRAVCDVGGRRAHCPPPVARESASPTATPSGIQAGSRPQKWPSSL